VRRFRKQVSVWLLFVSVCACAFGINIAKGVFVAAVRIRILHDVHTLLLGANEEEERKLDTERKTNLNEAMHISCMDVTGWNQVFNSCWGRQRHFIFVRGRVACREKWDSSPHTGRLFDNDGLFLGMRSVFITSEHFRTMGTSAAISRNLSRFPRTFSNCSRRVLHKVSWLTFFKHNRFLPVYLSPRFLIKYTQLTGSYSAFPLTLNFFFPSSRMH